MTALLALWLCALSIVGLYRSLPERGVRQDFYDVTLGILSSGMLAVSATIMVVSLISQPAVHPVGLPPGWVGW
jgi:predicted Kef-type K+ transport protein